MCKTCSVERETSEGSGALASFLRIKALWLVGCEGIWSHDPWRIEREVVGLVKMKCQPGGIPVMPWKRGDEVNVKRSIPTKSCFGRERSSIVAVIAREGSL